MSAPLFARVERVMFDTIFAFSTTIIYKAEGVINRPRKGGVWQLQRLSLRSKRSKKSWINFSSIHCSLKRKAVKSGHLSSLLYRLFRWRSDEVYLRPPRRFLSRCLVDAAQLPRGGLPAWQNLRVRLRWPWRTSVRMRIERYAFVRKATDFLCLNCAPGSVPEPTRDRKQGRCEPGLGEGQGMVRGDPYINGLKHCFLSISTLISLPQSQLENVFHSARKKIYENWLNSLKKWHVNESIR